MWKTLREVDLAAIARAAEEPFHLAVLGRPGTGRRTLVQAMRFDPHKDLASLAPVAGAYDLPLGAEDAQALHGAQAVVLLLDATQADMTQEHEAFQQLSARHVALIVAYNKADLVADARDILGKADQWRPAPVIAIAATDRARLESELVPALLRLLAGREIAVARALPLFRPAVVRRLIDDAAFANAAYSFTTGLAEVVPVLDVPLNVGDMVMLTKNQGLLAFKIALAMGLSADWRQTVPQLAAVVGAGFMWRQIGRSLVGLIPAWGIVPKVAVAYAGTVAVGQAVHYWAQTGERLKPAALQEAYRQAIAQGKEFADTLIRRAGERRRELVDQRRQLADQRRAAAMARDKTKKGHCPDCGRKAPRAAAWCPYCGRPLGPQAPALPAGEDGGELPPPGSELP